MLNRDIHIERTSHNNSGFNYYVAFNYQSKDPCITSAEDIMLPITAHDANKALRVCFAQVDGKRVVTRFGWIVRRNDGSMQFPTFHLMIDYSLNDTGEELLIKHGSVQLNATTWMFIDTTAFKNFVFTTMNNLLADSLRAEVERERSLQASNKPWHELVNKKYKTKLTKEKVHTINEFFTSDDEWWLSLNDETKAQIRAEWE